MVRQNDNPHCFDSFRILVAALPSRVSSLLYQGSCYQKSARGALRGMKVVAINMIKAHGDVGERCQFM